MEDVGPGAAMCQPAPPPGSPPQGLCEKGSALLLCVNDLLKDALADEFPTMVGQLATFCVKYVIVDSVAFATTATIAIMRLTAPISPGYDQEPRSQFSSWKKSVPALVTEAYDHE